ncbi:related to RTM1 protein [Phialocephala subalpina]|uniref:Related to RTM1 protein n=1 Tax=Phialocephala subalpina TaxID=576137 RepID=A0A1L7XQ22_9HELO|nr:related to RTM1 protein [Phialocephala subalpina]
MVDVKYMGLYNYVPSFGAAIVFTALFGITSIVHFIKLIRTRTWFFIPFLIGGLFETVGFAARAVSAHQFPNYTEVPEIIQAILILVAPALFAASIYMSLGRIIILTNGEKYAIIRRTWLTKIFVLGDIVSFLAQAGGAGLQAGGKTDQIKNGERIVKIGLLIQIVFFGLFILTSIIFHQRLSRHLWLRQSTAKIPWKKHIFALYISSALIFVRSIFRLAEYSQGSDGNIIQHEWYQYVFDAALMVGVMVLFVVMHPGEIKRLIMEKEADDRLVVNMS